MDLRTWEKRKGYRKINRKRDTLAEDLLYRSMKQLYKIYGRGKIQIKQEFSVYPYFIDYYIPNCSLGIEADGGYHKKRIEYDSRRDRFIESLDIELLRFDNDMIMKHIEDVVDFIDCRIRARMGKRSIKERIHFLETKPKEKVGNRAERALEKMKRSLV